MKRFISLLIAIGFAIARTQGQVLNTECNVGTDAGLAYGAVHSCISDPTDGSERCMYTYTPTCAAGKIVPLVFDIHAFTSCPYNSMFYTEWANKATAGCFVVVWPLGRIKSEVADLPCFAIPGGLESSDMTTPPCCCFLNGVRFETNSDPLFLRSAIMHTVESFDSNSENGVSIDTTRIYMAGHSNGCMAAMSMAVLHSDVVTAVCCYSGALLTPFADTYSPVPVMDLHGSLDDVVPVNGSTQFHPLAFTMNKFADKNDCDAEVIETDVENGIGKTYRRTNCTNNADVQKTLLFEAGHLPFRKLGGSSIDTTQIAWDFCKSYSKDHVPLVFQKTLAPSSTPSTRPSISPTEQPIASATGQPSASPTARPSATSAGKLSKSGQCVTTLVFAVVGALRLLSCTTMLG